MTLLSLDHLTTTLSVSGERRTVLRDLTLHVESGEALALVGESGSGKSMTARSIAGLLPAGASTTGSIGYDGSNLLDFDERQLRRFRAHEMAMIFQDPRVHMNPVRTVGEYLLEGMVVGQGRSPAEAEREVIALLCDVGISDGARRMGQYPNELSGGLLQRIMIAAAIAADPRILLADEPTTALDVSTQSDVMAIIDELRRDRGMALLFITHDLELAAAICDRMAVMYAGEIVEVAGSERLLTEPQHPYTAGLLGARPDVHHKLTRLQAVPGRPLAAFEAPSGCAFSDRCGYRIDLCETEHPPLEEADGGVVRCHRAASLHLGSPPTNPHVEAIG
jgi:oligopeptide/dipeptide ABC transporter ATP-binding protein